MKITKSKLKQIILEEMSSLETGEQRRDFQKMTDAPAQQQISFEEWVSAVSELGHEFGEASPNPYDAWFQGQSPEEYFSSLNERKLTKPEKNQKEKIVKGMKKSKKDFKKRYGDDAENVMYATATKIAKDKK